MLGRQSGLLSRQLAAMQSQAGELEAAVAQHSSEQAAAKAAADELLQRKAAAAKALRQAEKGQAKLDQAAAAAKLQAAKLRVQLKAAEAAAAGGDGAAGKGQKAGDQLLVEQEAAKHRCELRPGQVLLSLGGHQWLHHAQRLCKLAQLHTVPRFACHFLYIEPLWQTLAPNAGRRWTRPQLP